MQEITNGVYYTGVLNPNMRVFDIIMRTEYGTSYNSYIVKGSEKTALIEAAHLSFSKAYQRQLKEVLGAGGVDYLVLNHTEPDHTGCIAELLEEYPNLTIVASQAASIYIKNIVNRQDLKIQTVKDGESLQLGGKTLQFINAPFLHWPDSMFTYLKEDEILFSCDFLGCHYCEPQIFDTEIVYERQYNEALRYYFDCIFGPFKPYVLKGLEKIEGLPISFVCNSHGPVLTKNGLIGQVIQNYKAWATTPARTEKEIPVFYCSAYGNTALLANAIAKGASRAIPGAKIELYNIIEHNMAELTAILNECDAALIGSPTINRAVLPPVMHLLAGIEAVNFAKRPVALFGSFGWSGEALGQAAGYLTSLKAAVYEEQFKVNFVPTEADLKNAEEFGYNFGLTI